MQKDIDAGKTKKTEGALTGRHVGSLVDSSALGLVSFGLRLLTVERVPEFMRCGDEKESQILRDVPRDRWVTSSSRPDFVCCDDEPGPVQEDINARQPK